MFEKEHSLFLLKTAKVYFIALKHLLSEYISFYVDYVEDNHEEMHFSTCSHPSYSGCNGLYPVSVQLRRLPSRRKANNIGRGIQALPP